MGAPHRPRAGPGSPHTHPTSTPGPQMGHGSTQHRPQIDPNSSIRPPGSRLTHKAREPTPHAATPAPTPAPSPESAQVRGLRQPRCNGKTSWAPALPWVLALTPAAAIPWQRRCLGSGGVSKGDGGGDATGLRRRHGMGRRARSGRRDGAGSGGPEAPGRVGGSYLQKQGSKTCLKRGVKSNQLAS